jgi:hypothetical protein
MYNVELEQGVFLADIEGDPGRSTRKEYATIFETKKSAQKGLKKALEQRPFRNSKIVPCLKSSNKVYTKLPELEMVLKEFNFDRDKPVKKAKQISAITQVYDIIKRLGNFV